MFFLGSQSYPANTTLSTNLTNITATSTPVQTTGISKIHCLGVVDYDNNCGCANGGVCCKLSLTRSACTCRKGYQGLRCTSLEDPFFSYGDDPNSFATNSSINSTIALVAVGVLLTIVCLFILQRKCHKIQRRRWTKWQQARKQSEATIEGSAIRKHSQTEGQLPSFKNSKLPSVTRGNINSTFFLENDNILDRIDSSRKTSKDIGLNQKALDKIKPSQSIQTNVEDVGKDRKKFEDSKPMENNFEQTQTNSCLSDGIAKSKLSSPIPLVHLI